MIEEHVDVGTGRGSSARCDIGAGARIGANAVVTKDVAAGRDRGGRPGAAALARAAERAGAAPPC